MKISNTELFRPIFIVGAPRSGTTLLAVLLDRHSNIAIPPETQFFTEFLQIQLETSVANSREEKIDRALSFCRIQDIGIRTELVLEEFSRLPNTWPCLLQAILTVYSFGQKKKRVGEKSPKHIIHVPEILSAFPGAKIVCLVRDGRDVVRSLKKVPWAEPANPRRLNIFCMEWVDYAKLALRYQKQFTKDQFLLVKYENILCSPNHELSKICCFVGEEFEAGQLQITPESKVVPNWEGAWKSKSTTMLDPKRAEAWRTQADQKEIYFMNSMMGQALAKLGYQDTSLAGCLPIMRVVLCARKIPYLPVFRPVALLSLKLLRILKIIR